MIQAIERVFAGALALGLGAAAICAAAPAEAQGPSVLRVARGLAANDITVVQNRAVVVESAQPFVEVSVAQPEIADVSPLSDRAVYVFGRAPGTTTLTLLGEGGQLITNVPIEVIPDIGALKARLREVMPDDNVDVRAAGPNVILSGTVSSAKKVDAIVTLAGAYAGGNVVNMLTVGGTQQVMLKVRVAEMSREASKALGIRFNGFVLGEDVGGFTGGGGGDVGVVGTPIDAPTFDLNTLPVEDFGLGLLARFGDFGINLAVNALEEKNFARTLAEPNLVALSGETASFLVGGEVPIPVAQEEDTITVEFKRVGVILDFAPIVLTDDVINLSMSAEVSNVEGAVTTEAGSVLTLPTFSTNRSTTTVELRDGQSFAIAGLLRETFSDDVSQFPWLGDVPVLGSLFRSSSYLNRQSELVVIVTAHLVNPVDGDRLAIPQDRVEIPNEKELFLLGETAEYEPGDLRAQDFDGDFGYVVE